MRKFLMPVLLAGTFTLGGCTATGIAEQVLGSVLGGQGGYGNSNQGAYGNQNFQRAAIDACGQYASQYGRVSIQNVEQRSRSTLRVYGTIQTNNGFNNRRFACSFNTRGQITDFDVD